MTVPVELIVYLLGANLAVLSFMVHLLIRIMGAQSAQKGRLDLLEARLKWNAKREERDDE
jgi:hypothetical protein